MPQQGNNTGLTFSDPAVAPATVTEAAILRRRLDELEKIVAAQSKQLLGQNEEIRKLRLHVQALRGGARLAEDP